MEVYVEIYTYIATKFSVDLLVNSWKNLAFSFSEREFTLKIYINGLEIQSKWVMISMSGTPLISIDYGVITIGAPENYFTPDKLHVKDFIIWNRALFPEEAHKFIGLGGSNNCISFAC